MCSYCQTLPAHHENPLYVSSLRVSALTSCASYITCFYLGIALLPCKAQTTSMTTSLLRSEPQHLCSYLPRSSPGFICSNLTSHGKFTICTLFAQCRSFLAQVKLFVVWAWYWLFSWPCKAQRNVRQRTSCGQSRWNSVLIFCASHLASMSLSHYTTWPEGKFLYTLSKLHVINYYWGKLVSKSSLIDALLHNRT